MPKPGNNQREKMSRSQNRDVLASVGDLARKLAMVRAAVKHAFPTGTIEQMLGEIAAGYGEPPG